VLSQLHPSCEDCWAEAQLPVQIMRRVRQAGIPETRVPPKTADVGLVLLDLSFTPIACDRGAVNILNGKSSSSTKAEQSSRGELPFSLPKEVLEVIANCKPNELSSAKIIFRVGNSDYTCRAYLMEPGGGIPAIIALHLERVSSLNDAISAVAAKYRLSEREQEALRGITRGLSSKELAESMKISPNTVKVFMRLIMTKMGVTTRGAIVAHLLQGNSAIEEREDSGFRLR